MKYNPQACYQKSKLLLRHKIGICFIFFKCKKKVLSKNQGFEEHDLDKICKAVFIICPRSLFWLKPLNSCYYYVFKVKMPHLLFLSYDFGKVFLFDTPSFNSIEDSL